MRAHSLRAAEAQAQRARVVKVVVEPATQKAVLLLEDSSCLLVSLLFPSAAAISVPAPVTDACFLRLQAYGPAGAPTAGGFTNAVSPLSPAPARLAFGDATVAPGGWNEAERQSSTPRAGSSSSNRLAGAKGAGAGAAGQGLAVAAGRRELCLVTARPSKGGSCTDLRAWFCSGSGPSSYVPADIELELGGGRRSSSSSSSARAPRELLQQQQQQSSGGRVFARLDAPHGLAVKVEASINVLVVYSSSAGKFWVMAGKWSDQGVSSQTARPSGNCRALDTQRRCLETGTEDGHQKCLLLVKCAVVGCCGPVYSLHVSALHLFLGEKKGVRVWSLRPLIKPCSSGKKNGQAKARTSGTSEHSSRVSGRKLEGDTAGFRNRHQFEMEQNSGLDKVHDKKRTSNGIHLEERLGGVPIHESTYNLKVDDVVGGLDTKEPRKGMYTAREQFVSTNASGLAKHRRPRVDSDSHVQSADFAFRSLSELQSALSSDFGVQGDAPAVDKKTGNKILQDGGGGVIKNETRNGIIRSHSADHGGFSIKEEMAIGSELSVHSQGECVATSCSDLCQANKRNGIISVNKTVPWQRNGFISTTEVNLKTQDVSSQLTAQKTSHQTGGPVQIAGSSVQNRKDGKEMGIPGPWFIALYGSEEDVVTSQFSSSAISRPSPQLQVVDIQGLGLNDYIVLDSQGKLHLLTLQELSEEQKIGTFSSNFLSISHLRSSMQVSSFAVLPPPPPLPHIPGVTFSPMRESVRRKLWISDGMHSVHIVTISEENFKAKIDSAKMESNLLVSQAVFTKEPVEGLVAASAHTAMVLMRGQGVWPGHWLSSNSVRWQETPLAQEEQHRTPKASMYSVVDVLRDTFSFSSGFCDFKYRDMLQWDLAPVEIKEHNIHSSTSSCFIKVLPTYINRSTRDNDITEEELDFALELQLHVTKFHERTLTEEC